MSSASLKLRLTLFAALFTSVAMLAIALMLVSGIDRHLVGRAADDLGHQLDQLASLFVLDENAKPRLEADLSDPRYERPLSGLYWQISDDAGAVLRSRSLWDTVLDLSPVLSGTATPVELAGPGNKPVLTLSREVTLRDTAGDRKPFRLTVALDANELAQARAAVLRPIFAGLALASLALIVAAGMQLGIGLRPLERMRQELERVRLGSEQHLRLEAFPTEIRPLGEEINTLLDGHRSLVERARRRAGDLAHGLKTPLAALSAQADLLAGRGDADSAAALRRQIQSMQTHVERELAMARSQGGRLALGTSAFPVREIAAAIDVLKKLPAAQPLQWSVVGDEAVSIMMATDDFAEVVGNLLDNARKWARTKVAATTAAGAAGVRIVIDDDGPGIAPDGRAASLVRGRRLDEAVPGTGLGLSIVSSILESYGIPLELGSSAHGGLAASFTVPAAHAT